MPPCNDLVSFFWVRIPFDSLADLAFDLCPYRKQLFQRAIGNSVPQVDAI
jgi:hypothetical protein